MGQPSTFGAAPAQAIQMSGLDAIKGTTRFSDLHPSIQSEILALDEAIQMKVSRANGTRESLPKHVEDVASIAPDVTYIENYLSTVELGLDNDSINIAQVRALVKADADDAALSFRAVENQKLPSQFHYGNPSSLASSTAKSPHSASLASDDTIKPVDLVGFFKRRTASLGDSLDVYQRQIRELETHLRTMEAGTMEKAHQLSGSRSSSNDQRRQLVDALKAIEGAILDSAKKVGQVRDDVTKQTMSNVAASLA